MRAGMPVRESKCILFKALARNDAFPVLIDTRDVNKIVETVRFTSSSFSGVSPKTYPHQGALKSKEGLRKKSMSLPSTTTSMERLW